MGHGPPEYNSPREHNLRVPLVDLTKRELENFKERRPYERLRSNSDVLIARLEPIRDLLACNVLRNEQVIAIIRRYFEFARRGPAAEIAAYYPCDKRRFNQDDIESLNKDIKDIDNYMEKIGKPMGSLEEFNDLDIPTIIEETKKTIEASERIMALSLRRLRTLE